MYFPQFLVGTFTTSGGMALWTYMATGSTWTALGWTVATLIVLQVGYFVLVLRLACKREAQRPEAEADQESANPIRPLF
jgi:flagellar biosynthesis/type III secretory pathway M-ring protein FliF/YscJ